MPDDANDRLMQQFIEKASPKLIESMQEHLSKQFDEKISGLVEHNKKLLDEVKDAKRERDALSAKNAADFTQLKTLLERGESPASIKSALNPEPITLTREQARDPAIYRRAKAQAQQNGTTLAILDA